MHMCAFPADSILHKLELKALTQTRSFGGVVYMVVWYGSQWTGQRGRQWEALSHGAAAVALRSRARVAACVAVFGGRAAVVRVCCLIVVESRWYRGVVSF